MLNPNDFPKPKPTVKPADLGDANVAVVIIEKAEQTTIGGDKKVVMQFEEFPGKNYFPNRTSIYRLIDGLGPDEKGWAGKQAVLEVVKTNDPDKRRQVDALWVAEAEHWADHIDAQTRRAARKTATEPKAGSGSGAKTTTKKK